MYYGYGCEYTTYSYLVPKAGSRPRGKISNLSLYVDDQGSGRYQHIKKIRNEKLKWIWKKKKENERIGNRMQHF